MLSENTTEKLVTKKNYKPLSIEDRQTFKQYFFQGQPETSELTFTNLFMWRCHYNPVWRLDHDCLLIVQNPDGLQPYGLPPMGPGDKPRALAALADDLSGPGAAPRICRVGRNYVDQYVDPDKYQATATPDHYDYVYLSTNLISLSGRKLHQKKNHLNQFLKNNDFEIKKLDLEMVECVLEMQESWCKIRDCDNNPDLLNEDRAIFEALKNFEHLDYQGLAIVMDAKVQAFSFGEALNNETMVIHIEKANPEIRGLYAAVNQLYVKELGAGYQYINREQDLGVEGLRRAKESYHPHHLVEKYEVAVL